jgi:hypothetical protein
MQYRFLVLFHPHKAAWGCCFTTLTAAAVPSTCAGPGGPIQPDRKAREGACGNTLQKTPSNGSIQLVLVSRPAPECSHQLGQ